MEVWKSMRNMRAGFRVPGAHRECGKLSQQSRGQVYKACENWTWFVGNGEPWKGRNRGVSWSSSGFKNSLYLLCGGWIRKCWRQADQAGGHCNCPGERGMASTEAVAEGRERASREVKEMRALRLGDWGN